MIKTMSLHPDSLYDAFYQDVSFDTDDFLPVKFEYKGEYSDEKGVTVITQSGDNIRLESVFDDTIRFRILKSGQTVLPSVTERLGLIDTKGEKNKYFYEFKDNVLKFSNEKLNFKCNFENGKFEFSDKSNNVLLSTVNGGANFSQTDVKYSGIRSFTTFKRSENERFFGFGARMYKLDRTGSSVDIFSEKGGTKSGDYGGFPVPYFISTKGFGLFFNNPWPHVYFDMAKTESDKWYINSPGGDYDIFVFAGGMSDIIKRYTAITGRNKMPKKYLMGYWCSSLMFDEADAVLTDIEKMKDGGYPIDAIVIDGPWRGGKNFIKDYKSGWGYPSNDYDWHPDFGDGKGMIKKLEKDGIKTILHINSCAFKPETAIPNIAKGLLRQVKTETVPELMTSEGREFYKKLLKPRIDDGVKQWWTDHSDRVSGEIEQGIPSRNLFGVLWNREISKNMAENGVENHMSLSRGGGIGSQKYALPWAGDTEFGIHRFEDDIWYILNASLAGFTLCGYDLGGFMRKNQNEGDANAEQFEINNIARRMCQSMIFCPMPRMHNGDVAEPKWPWNCPEETRALYRDCLKFRYKFIPNIYSYAVNAVKTGEPLLRPLFYSDIKNEKLYDINTEFYLGDDILFAPVTKKDELKKEVYLPGGTWIDFWTKRVYEGDRNIMRSTPLLQKEGLPMFIRQGGGLAFQKDCTHLTDEIPDFLEIELYPDNFAKITLNESENVTNEFSCEIKNGKIEITAQNNSDKQRVYKFSIFVNSKVYETEIAVDKNSAKKYEIEIC